VLFIYYAVVIIIGQSRSF